MRKAARALAFFVLALTLTACGQSGGPPPDPTKSYIAFIRESIEDGQAYSDLMTLGDSMSLSPDQVVHLEDVVSVMVEPIGIKTAVTVGRPAV